MHSSIKNPKYKRSKKDVPETSKYESDQDHQGRKNQQLCIEIEMNESVRNLLASPERCKSTLLDVTVIRTKDDQKDINTMNGNEVRKFLANLDKEKKEKRMISELLEDKSGSDDTVIKISKHNPKKMQVNSDICYEAFKDKRVFKNKFHKPARANHRNNQSSSAHPVDTTKYNHCYSPGVTQVAPALNDTNYRIPSAEDSCSDISVEKFKCGDHKKQHVYAAARTYKDLNAIITCQSMSKDTGTPCLCEHCGIASLLSETIKRPIITAPVEHVSELRRKMNRKEYRECSKHADYQRRRKPEPTYSTEEKTSALPPSLVHLFERVKILEDRMDAQEERAVPKDYFKRIITKIITHFSPRMTYKNDNFIGDSDSETYVDTRYKNNYSVNAFFVDGDARKKKKQPQKEQKVPDARKASDDGFWKWGSEVLRPGIDLKNKIMSLLEVADKRRAEPSDRPKTSEDRRRKDSSPNVLDRADMNSEAFKNFVDAMSAKIYNAHKKSFIFGAQSKRDETRAELMETSNQTLSDTSLYKRPKNDAVKNARSSKAPKNSKTTEIGKKLNVSYLNPKLSTWQEEESQISFRLEFSDADTTKSRESKNRELEKLEFLKTLSRTKDSDKEKLWESIWAQAKSNGQSKQDKVTIQLPKKNESNQFNDMIEIEFTIAEIEYMLTKHKFEKLDAMVKEKNKSKS